MSQSCNVIESAKIRLTVEACDKRFHMQRLHIGRQSENPSARLRLCALLAPFFLMACNTKAVAIQECRDIEEARCEASVPCGVIEEEEVDACKRFYRDQCLHGISGPKAPTGEEQKLCLELINDAKSDAATSMGGASQDDGYTRACKTVSTPWEEPECAFLRPAGPGGESGDGDGAEE
jgi:hypothetical protein